MERLTSRYYPKMEIGFCTEIDCLARDFCPGLKKHNRLYEYEETGLTPEQILTLKLVLQQRYAEAKGIEKSIYGEVLEMLGGQSEKLVVAAARFIKKYCDVHCFYENDGVCTNCAFAGIGETCPLDSGTAPADWKL